MQLTRTSRMPHRDSACPAPCVCHPLSKPPTRRPPFDCTFHFLPLPLAQASVVMTRASGKDVYIGTGWGRTCLGGTAGLVSTVLSVPSLSP
jgi:hypothetical protein